VKCIAVTLKAFRWRSFAPSASMTSIAALIASGMYIMSREVSSRSGQVKEPFMTAA